MENKTNSKSVNIKDYSVDPNLSVEVKAFLKGLNKPGGAGLETLPPAEARKVLVNAQASVKVDLSGIIESEETIEDEGYTVKLNIVRPRGAKGKLPAFIFVHGGGWVLGDYPTHKRMVRDLSVLSNCCGIFVNYTRTPEVKYPHALNEIFTAVKWISKHAPELDIDGEKIAIVGNSAGGNLTAATTLMAKKYNGPEIKLQILLWPVTDANFNTESYKLFGKDRFLTSPLMIWMHNMYTTEKERSDPYAYPLEANVDQLKGLPPALIITAENDILRDEGEAYGRKLNEAGVKVTTVRYNGMIHDFGLLNGLANIPETRSMFEYAAAELKKYLG
jgi:acetyl esterase/lipase